MALCVIFSCSSDFFCDGRCSIRANRLKGRQPRNARFTGHKRNADYERSAFNDEYDFAEAARLLCSCASDC
ncbi:hypothetical protein DESC_890004 [Desulfosarcina cetonica]|nr:hypothetical protein DESC_890004 [Desulfosarcina cetonica]